MVNATIRMIVPRGKRKEVLQTIGDMLDSIRRERGCIGCNYYMDVEDENVFCLKEQWMTREDLDNHLRSESFDVLIGAMSLLSSEPDFMISTVQSTTGFGAIKGVRPRTA
ncbi:putative quinol monooxygenase [Geobacter sp. SVR]|uniref:putative quinol monooxygenase n=1 Tax=Geobacter sp. SVR TaxID=2495594 RepID=UPI00143EFDB3|nr:antibiotic biosynthesis monooxygenase family protein [Geobacter sp. SVR]BCS54851.1 hypothetical protein GSVR_31590 [Geobacter sp. SVR]GCF86341.1 antibiotic biosynthesis monooxygenase [Geobacter sp. SVR]